MLSGVFRWKIYNGIPARGFTGREANRLGMGGTANVYKVTHKVRIVPEYAARLEP